MTFTFSKKLVFFINGRKVEDENVDPEWTLLYYLRNKLRLCGTKLGCGEGGCGACTVMVSKCDRKKNSIVHLAVNACLVPVCGMHGLAVTTVEGIGSVAGRLHPVQERIAKAHGSQCGFCTPGIVMSMYSLLRSLERKPTMEDIEIAFQGNLCRCTGYRPIIEGYRPFTSSEASNDNLCSVGKNCCKNIIRNAENDHEGPAVNGVESLIENQDPKNSGRLNGALNNVIDPSQEVIFPPELIVSDEYDNELLFLQGPRVCCFRPTTLSVLIELKSEHPDACIVNGNTEVGIEMKFKNKLYPYIIIANMIPELSNISVDREGVRIGAGVTISEIELFLREVIISKGDTECKIFSSMIGIIKYFAGKQIRNVAAIGGNIMTGSPISDLNPVLMAAGAKLEFRSKDGHRELLMDSNFWVGYRKNITREDEVLTSIFVPFTTENHYFKAYKQSRRRDDDIAIVNAAFFLDLEGKKIKNIRMAFGGMAPTTILANKTEKFLIGRLWNESMLSEALTCLASELILPPDAPGGMVQYRRSLALSFFFKFYLHVCNEIKKFSVQPSLESAISDFQSLSPSSSQFYSINPAKEEHSKVGQPVVHQSAYKHATGEAVYCDDVPSLENEAYMVLVTSSRPHAKILSIDASKALQMEGVFDFISAKDILPERNNYGSIVHDEEIFASNKVLCVGQIVGAIIAVNQATAQIAAKLVKINYQDILPVVISIKEAIEKKSYFEDSPFTIKRGNTQKGFEESDLILEGDLSIGGQEHFYLETQACIVNPKTEDDELEIISSSQHPSEVQSLVSHALGIPNNRIVCKVKRMGGGFGGKETRCSSLVLPAAVAAHKLKRPVRAMLDRDEDMVITGHRHPFYGKYKVGCQKTGKIKACEVSLYCNAGCSKDLSDAVMERAMTHVSNTFLLENVTCHGYVCRTNLPSNTAFRGFGAPQAMLLGETMIFHIADNLGQDPELIHSLNFYKNGDITHFKQPIVNCTIEQCWKECIKNSNYHKRKEDVCNFNRKNRYKKRGLALIPTMFGIGFSTPFLNQAGALVLVYVDGSVLISHGGTEMGQGLHTKMIQVASRALNIPSSLIHISETSTDKVPNTSATAGSASSDLNGMAILNACIQINDRLAPVKKSNPSGRWEDWIKEAYLQRISLAASGFYKTEGIGLEPNAETGNVFNYFTYGAACSEVEVDCLTGDHQVLRTDIVMDLGESLNPAIDIGQIEGAFVQGYGLFTLEELIYSPKGVLYSRGPGAYKIPGFADIPATFNVSLLKGAPNPRAVYSSKAVGEPPLFLASSVFFAIRQAVQDARKECNANGWFTFNSPATAERIRTACIDEIIDKVGPVPDCSNPWNIAV